MYKKGFFASAMDGDTESVLEFLDTVEGKDSYSMYACAALTCASWKGRLATVTALCTRGIDVNLQNNAGQTALMYAARWGDVAIVRTLIAYGADVSIADYSGKTALASAEELENNDEVIALIQAQLQRE